MKRTVVAVLSLWSLVLIFSAVPLAAQQDVVGAVYTMSNDPSGNAVLVFNRAADGRLTFSGAFSTGGLGTGGREPDFGLANAGALALGDDNRLLFVVNPGSDDVSVFAVKKKGLELVDRESSTYTVGKDGRATGPIVTPSDAQTPFGFYLANGNQLFISDDFNDAPGAGALSSYLVADDGSLQLVSSAVRANESGACWTVVSNDGRFAYNANTVSSTVSLYTINKQNGSVTFEQSFQSLFSPTDLDVSGDGRFLYALNPDINGRGSPGINVFRRNERDGSLIPLPGVSGLPTSVDGLVAR